MVKQPFVVDIDIDVLFQEMAKTLNTHFTPTPILNKILKFALYYLLIIYMLFVFLLHILLCTGTLSNGPAKQGNKKKIQNMHVGNFSPLDLERTYSRSVNQILHFLFSKHRYVNQTIKNYTILFYHGDAS